MKFFDIFTIKKDTDEMVKDDSFKILKKDIEADVINFLKDESKTGERKKQAVIYNGVAWIKTFIAPRNSFIAKTLVILLPHYIQGVYDLLKRNVDKIIIK